MDIMDGDKSRTINNIKYIKSYQYYIYIYYIYYILSILSQWLPFPVQTPTISRSTPYHFPSTGVSC